MKKLLLLLVLGSCVTTKPVVYETVIECNDQEAMIWVKQCLSDSKLDSTSDKMKDRYTADCWKVAHAMFCKKVQQPVVPETKSRSK